jgi:hypothetical protein
MNIITKNLNKFADIHGIVSRTLGKKGKKKKHTYKIGFGSSKSAFLWQ